MHDCLQWETTALPMPGYAHPDLRGTHNVLCSRLGTPDPTILTPLKTLSRQRSYALRAFHAVRVTSDYHLGEDVTLEDAKQALAEAARIFAMI